CRAKPGRAPLRAGRAPWYGDERCRWRDEAPRRAPHERAMPYSYSSIPPSIPQAERLFRVNWMANLKMTPSGVPFVSADFVGKQGRKVRVVDVRSADELVGALGYVPGSDWIPLDRIGTLIDRVELDDPVVVVSGGEERSHDAAAALAKAGLRFVAFMVGGVMA